MFLLHRLTPFNFDAFLPTMHHLLSSQHKHSISQSNLSVIPSVSRQFFFHKAMALHRNPTISLASHLLFGGAIELQCAAASFRDSTGVRLFHLHHPQQPQREKKLENFTDATTSQVYLYLLLIS